MATLVVGRDGDVDEFGRGVGVAEGDDGDVDVGSFFDGLSVGSGIGQDDQTWFLEGARDVVGEVSGVKRPAMATAPVWAANLRTARWPYGRAEMTQISAGLSTAATMRAARTIFSLWQSNN